MMTILEFFLGIFTVVTAGVVALCFIAMVWDTKELEKENAELKEQLKKVKKSEYKKVKEVK